MLRFIIASWLILIFPCLAQPLPNARLAGALDPHQSVNTPFTTLYYTDGQSVGLSLNLASLTAGVYDVYQNNGVLTTSSYALANHSNPNWVGSFSMSVAGQLTTRNDLCAGGSNGGCKWELYNGFNQRPAQMVLITQEQNLSYCPTNPASAPVPFNNNPNNNASVFTGEPETIELLYHQRGYINTTNGSYGVLNFIGVDIGQPSAQLTVGTAGCGSRDAPTGPYGTAAFAGCFSHAVLKDMIGSHSYFMMIGAAKNSNGCPGNLNVVNSANTPGVGYTPDDQGHLSIRWMW